MDYRDTHIDVPLTNLAIGYRPKDLIADLVCPRVKVAKPTNKFIVYGSENMKLTPTLRDPKGKSNEVSRSMSTDDYYCNPHALHELINDDDRSAVPDGANLESGAVMGLMDRMAISLEAEVASLFTTTGNYSSSTYYETVAANDQWSNASADIEGQVLDAVKVVKDGCASEANAIIIPWSVAHKMRRNTQIIERMKHTNPNMISSNILPPTLYGLKVFIAGAQKDTVQQGQSGITLSEIWSDYVCVFYHNPTAGWFDMAFTKNFSMGQLGFYVKRIPQPGDYIKGLEKIELNDEGRDPKIICNTAGYLFQDVLA